MYASSTLLTHPSTHTLNLTYFQLLLYWVRDPVPVISRRQEGLHPVQFTHKHTHLFVFVQIVIDIRGQPKCVSYTQKESPYSPHNLSKTYSI